MSEEKVVPKQGVLKLKSNVALAGDSHVADQDHLYSENELVDATLVLHGLVRVKGMHVQVAMFRHRRTHPGGVFPVDDQSHRRRPGRVGDGQLVEEEIQLVVGQQRVPVSHAQPKRHVPEDHA